MRTDMVEQVSEMILEMCTCTKTTQIQLTPRWRWIRNTLDWMLFIIAEIQIYMKDEVEINHLNSGDLTKTGFKLLQCKMWSPPSKITIKAVSNNVVSRRISSASPSLTKKNWKQKKKSPKWRKGIFSWIVLVKRDFLEANLPSFWFRTALNRTI